MAGLAKGWDGAVLIGSATMVNINSWELNVVTDAIEITDFGDSYDRYFQVGKRNYTGTISGFAHTTDAAHLAVMGNVKSTAAPAAATVVLLTHGTTGAKAGYTGSAIFTNITRGVPADGMQTVSLTAQFSGGMTVYST